MQEIIEIHILKHLDTILGEFYVGYHYFVVEIGR